MPQNWNINPQTGDYVMDGGAPEETNSLLIPAYFRLKVQRQTWLYAPDNSYGSDFATLKKNLTTGGSADRIEQVAAAAVQPIADDGRASEIVVEAKGLARHGAELQVTITDAAGNVEETTFKGLGL